MLKVLNYGKLQFIFIFFHLLSFMFSIFYSLLLCKRLNPVLFVCLQSLLVLYCNTEWQVELGLCLNSPAHRPASWFQNLKTTQARDRVFLVLRSHLSQIQKQAGARESLESSQIIKKAKKSCILSWVQIELKQLDRHLKSKGL